MKLTVNGIQAVGNDRYNVSFTGSTEGFAPGSYPAATNLVLNLSKDEAKEYFPGDVYELTLKASK